VYAGIRKVDALSAEQANYQNLIPVLLDVNNERQRTKAVESIMHKEGKIDVLVNNAGFAVVGVFESTTEAQWRAQIETNLFGLFAMTKAVLPHMRAARSGCIINIASVGGHLAFPLYSLYHATKWAVEGYSESLQYELAQIGIRVKVVEPGPIATDFYGRSMDRGSPESQSATPLEYKQYATHILASMDSV
jgi:short-subunit dehydrogenase